MQYWNSQTIDKIRKGFYSAVYFSRTREILLREKNLQKATMQIFQKQNSVLCGINLVLELFNLAAGYFENETWKDKRGELKIESLPDGSLIEPWETVMHITGPYAYFAHLESLYLGILARATKITTNTKKVVDAAKGKQVIFFADRFDYFLNQELDGYSAKIGGIHAVASPAQASLWKGSPTGTIPHALIALNKGSTQSAAEQFMKHFPASPLIVLVDFKNDCVNTSLEVAEKLGKKLWGVRLDTSETIIDKSLGNLGDKNLTGVNEYLVKNVRNALDRNGFNYVKIVVSGGFNEEKIKRFEEKKIPVDVYGVGSALLRGNIDFTADIVKVEGMEIAKTGREFKQNTKLKIVK